MIRFPLIVSFGLIYIAAPAQAQVVQLPTFHQFSTSTTVAVPDRGSISLGGVGRTASGGNHFGGPAHLGNRATGAAAQAGRASVSAQIHDFAAMDRRLLEKAPATREPTRPKTTALRPHTADPAVASISEIQQARLRAAQDAQQKVLVLLRRADDAFDAGKHSVAKIYYEMALRRAEGSTLNTALTKLERCKQALQSQRKR